MYLFAFVSVLLWRATGGRSVCLALYFFTLPATCTYKDYIHGGQNPERT